MDTSTEGWVVLPDHPDARRVIAGCPSRWRPVLAHASGNPWLVGDFGHDTAILATVGAVRVAVIGSCPVTATRLTELVAQTRTAAELDALARALPGCFHLLASVAGVVRVQGSLTGLRAVFHARLGRVPVAGDRADVLAWITGAGVDEQSLATRVVCGPQVPPPVCEHTLWTGVRALPTDHYLRIDPGNRCTEVCWWRPPEPEVPLGVGAGVVRQALTTAVGVRRSIGGRLSADLSGGLDSTSLCYLAARGGVSDLLTFRRAEAEAGNDDALFAAMAVAELPGAEHVVLDQTEMPGNFADPGDNGDTEAPYRFGRTLARYRHTTRLLAAHGAGVHVAGHGGDEVFHAFPTYLHPLSRRRPLTAVSHVRGHRALHRWTWTATLSSLASRGDLGAWWRQQARQLTSGPLLQRTPRLDWGFPLRAREWVTPAALDTARAVLRSVGDTARPLAGDRGQHVAVALLRTVGPGYRQLARVFAAAGIRLELPYLDDRVVEAALAVRPHERTTPWRYKPLLVEAMRGILPEQLAARTTKGEFGEDVRVGLRRHLGEILDLFADSALASSGFIDPDLLRRELLAPQAGNAVIFALEDLLGCETWLRTAVAAPLLGRDHANTTAR
ncbi:MAG: asparagine synthase [Kutzneria sp.]|nr:asparagine synthase [Kutzneria sp.]